MYQQGARSPAVVGVSGAGFIERRSGYDRRRTGIKTFLRGGLTPRRRNGGRRRDDYALFVDWHEPHLLFLAIAILLLSVTDAFMTVTLLSVGAHEANPVMELVLQQRPELFAAVKMALTGAGVLVLVACARATLFRIIRVSAVMHWFLLLYAGLIAYEYWLLREFT
ncbi:MAG TPA: DUF5658 family protein [Gammaproteobacteria bacterium]